MARLGSWEWQVGTDELWFSDELWRICGQEPRSFRLTVATCVKLAHPEDQDRVRRQLEGAFERHYPYACDHRIIRPDGTVRWLRNLGTLERDETGRPIRQFGTSQDITEQKRAEEALRESEALFRVLFESNPTPMGRITLSAHFVQVNDALCRLLGHSREEFLNWSIQDITYPDDREKEREDKGIKGVKRLVGRDGQPIWVELSGGLVRDPAGTPLFGVVIVQDIRERVQAEEERQRMETRLRETQKLESLGILAGGVAHDFNNLLTVILGNTSLVETDLPEDSHARPLLQQVVSASWRAADLVKQMLAYAGRGQFVVSRVDLNVLIREMRDLLRTSLSRLVRFRLDLAESVPTILADPSQLRQVILNLVSNGAEAIGEQTGEVRLATGVLHAKRDDLARMYLAPELPEGDYVFLEVTDTGCGMDEATREKIFDPFFTTKFLGRGLGLAAVVGIVRSHQGAIQAESQPGQGSTFRVLLPVPAESGR